MTREYTTMTRRSLLATSAMAAGSIAVQALPTAATAATVEAGGTDVGYAIARVRGVATEELSQAVFADALTHFLPENRAIAGFRGYVLARSNDDTTSHITMSLLADEAAAAESTVASEAYVSTLDPRYKQELQHQEQGPVRVWALTERSKLDVPPALTGCQFTMRSRISAEGIDIDAVIAKVTSGLVQQLSAMAGFVLYGWFLTNEGRTSFNIFETREQLEAGDTIVADWVAANTADTTVGEAIVNEGTIGYAEIAGLA